MMTSVWIATGIVVASAAVAATVWMVRKASMQEREILRRNFLTKEELLQKAQEASHESWDDLIILEELDDHIHFAASRGTWPKGEEIALFRFDKDSKGVRRVEE